MYDYISVCVTLVSSVCVCLYLLLPLPLSKLRSIRQKFKAYTHTDAPSLTFSHATAKYSTKKRVATTKLCCSFCCHLCNCKQTKASNQNETQPKQGRERERSKMPKPTKKNLPYKIEIAADALLLRRLHHASAAASALVEFVSFHNNNLPAITGI